MTGVIPLVIKRNVVVLVGIVSLIANCVLGFLLHQRSRITTQSSDVYASFQDTLHAAVQSSNAALNDSGKQVQYDVNQENNDLVAAASLLQGMQPQMLEQGIDFSRVINALNGSYIPNLRISNVIQHSDKVVKEVWGALGHTTYRTGSVSALRQRVTALSAQLASQRH